MSNEFFGVCKVCGVELSRYEAEDEAGLHECETCMLEGDQNEMRTGYRWHSLLDED